MTGQATPASLLTQEQISSISEALVAIPESEEPDSLRRLIRGLVEGQQTAFNAEDLARLTAASEALRVPLEERKPWTASASRGLFLVFEGLDRSGKSTQSRRLAQHLEKAGEVRWMCFPDRFTPSGTLIDLYLRKKIDLDDATVHLLFSANRWERARALVDELNQGVSIICDRYAFSGVAYSSAKGLDLGWCQDPDRGLPCPDGIFFLHIDEKVGASRSDFGDERYENADMQSQVRNRFQLAELRAGVPWHDVDGARDMEVIHTEIKLAVEAIAKQEGERPLPQLWVE